MTEACEDNAIHYYIFVIYFSQTISSKMMLKHSISTVMIQFLLPVEMYVLLKLKTPD